MFRNYLTVALRNMVRHKLYSIINIAGLAVGLACVLFIVLFVRDELSYDQWLPGTEHLYRLEMTLLVPGRPVQPMAVLPFAMPAAMKDEIPEVTGMTRVFDEEMTLTAGDRQFDETVDLVDPGFFQIIKLKLIAGDPQQVLREPESIVLSQSAARKYFGDADPLGKTITTGRGGCEYNDTACVESTIALKVTGIARDIPHNSQLLGEFFVPNNSLADRYQQRIKECWFCENGYGYLQLAPGADPQSVIAKAAPLLKAD